MTWDVYPGSGFFSIPDPGVKKAPDPGSESATLTLIIQIVEKGLKLHNKYE